MSKSELVLAVPAKGRMAEEVRHLFQRAGLDFALPAAARRYQEGLRGINGVQLQFAPAAQIARRLHSGALALGISGEDLLREEAGPGASAATPLEPLGIGRADVVVAIPNGWWDIDGMEALADLASDLYDTDHRPLRVATKYQHLTRRFFAQHRLGNYRILASTGATEAAPEAGTADIIVDITSSGRSLRDNRLKRLADGTILSSQAVLAQSARAPALRGRLAARRDQLMARLAAARDAPAR